MSDAPNADYASLIAMADAMLLEKQGDRQKTFDKAHPEYEGKIGATSPLDSAERRYRFYRCQWSDELGLPKAYDVLRGRTQIDSSEDIP